MVVRDIQAVEDAAGTTLSARIEGAGLNVPSTVWFHYPSILAPFVARNGDPFFPAALLAAMRHDRRLIIRSDVSTALLEASSRIMGHYAAMPRPPSFHRIEVTADAAPRKDRGGLAGTFFSCGVDSLYTLLANVARYPSEDSRSISHLVLVHGFDIALEDEKLFASVREQAEVVAQALGKTLVVVRTNVRALLTGMDWARHAVGPAMASVGLSLGRLFHTLHISSGPAFVELKPPATGCHPGLDPLWSTETLEFVHTGAEKKKGDKVAFIASSPLALRVLRVCWKNPDGAYNCGRCEKCLNTMVLLQLCGALDRAATFPRTLDLARIAGADPSTDPFRRVLWLDMLARAKAAGGHPGLSEAIESALATGAWRDTRPGQVETWTRRVLDRIHLSPAPLRTVDRVMLGGLGIRLLRRARRSLSVARVRRGD